MSNVLLDPEPISPCPRCGATHVVRNGKTQSDSPNFLCRGCGRCFVAAPKKGPVTQERKDLVRRLLLERISLRGIAPGRRRLPLVAPEVRQRVVPRGDGLGAGAAKKKSGELILEADEMWSFVGKKREAWWIWVALDAGTRQVVAMMAGGRTEYTARCLWEALPEEYRAGAVVFTDFWAAYAAVIPESQHIRCGKGDGMTNHVERFWCTVRQRCSRFVRKTLSFSKCDSNHIGALWYFVRHYNESLW